MERIININNLSIFTAELYYEYYEDLATEAEQAQRENDCKRMYDITRKLSGKSLRLCNQGVRDKDGIVQTNEEKQLKIWMEYIREQFTNKDPEELIDFGERNIEELKVNTNNITKLEIQKAIKSLKNNKAAGIDNIQPEMLKVDEKTSTEMLFGLFQKIWSEEKIPNAWKTGLLVKIPKKGDRTKCENWRGITLLSIASKVLTRILLERLKAAIDKKLRINQAGFRARESCTDHIATLRIIVEQSIEWQSNLYLNFIDFQRAFDSVHRESTWKLLRYYGILCKFIIIIKFIIKAFYPDFNVQIIHNGTISENVPIETGVRQGCILSPTIFLIIIDWIMKKATRQKRGIAWRVFESLEDLDFADDICLLSHKAEHMQAKTDDLVKEGKRIGLRVNVNKTQTMRINSCERPILIENQSLENVNRFTYLGSTITSDGGALEDAKARVNKARHVFQTLAKVWRSKNITLNTKLRIFNTNVKSVLLYGAETWLTSKTLINHIQCFVNKCLRRILQVFWPNKISNEELWTKTNQEKIELTVKRRTWRWIGHTLRKPDEDITKQALIWNPSGSRKRGRPRDTWRRHREKEMKKNNTSWDQVKLQAKNRTRWRGIVEALCSSGNERD